MDYLPSLNAISFNLTGSVGFVQSAFAIAVVLVVLCIEVPRRFAAASREGGAEIVPRSASPASSVKTGVQIVVHHAPEIAGLMVVLTAAVALRIRNDAWVPTGPGEAQVWEQVKREWPLLQGADTLIGLQQMIRLVMLAGSVHHAKDSSMTGMAAVFALSAGVARAALAGKSMGYWLDGPLGGGTAACVEAAAVPMLAKLAFDKLRRSPIKAAAMVSAVTWYASHHYLTLASAFGEDVSIDKLYTLSHMLELCSALAFLVNTFVSEDQPKASFVHLLMPVQQGLSAYYFLTAFANGSPGQWIGAGRPWCLLIIGALAQFGIYLSTAAFHLARSFDGSPRERTANTRSATASNDSTEPNDALTRALAGDAREERAARDALNLARQALSFEGAHPAISSF